MSLRRRLTKIERDVATRAEQRAADEAAAALVAQEPGKRVWSPEELAAAFDQYIPGWRPHAQVWLEQYARLGLLPTRPTHVDEAERIG